MARKPVIAITMGDPAGIGPEIVLKALASPETRRACRPLILGDWGLLRRWQRRLPNAPEIVCWRSGEPLAPLLESNGPLPVCSLSSLSARDLRPGRPTKAGGHATYRYIVVAAKLALSKVADAIATAPINKSILMRAGYPYPGHTELLAELSRTPQCRMMLIGGKLRVVPVTGHIGLKRVPQSLTRANIRLTFELADRALRELFGIRRPRIAAAALNPHAGEEGIFGREESDVIAPAVRAAKRQGIEACGPLPADSLFHHAARGAYDAVVCMYHDQALIPLKLHDFHGGVALTLGPPFIRTSVDHGTAYDIAGTGKADESSMREAIVLAAHLARTRSQRRQE
ncbi:MAG TPA: 4-hydroxythreonine-4-phosphate dehydrogenase PdxA [Candidatus Eisenbacteria bacterium]|nr:4-hydroxythreonine-4-phosphate dehydrogenase PdxA [Candidatus Eisenbacteria bacterium]